MPRVLVITDKKPEAQRMMKIFKTVQVPCETVVDFDAAFARITEEPPALVVADKPNTLEKIHALKSVLKTAAPATPFIALLNQAKMAVAIEVMAAGAFDCVSRPYSTMDVLMAAKRATLKSGRLLFVSKLRHKKQHPIRWALGAVIAVLIFFWGYNLRLGPPSAVLSLGSANLAGIQWEGRRLWVADWFETTVTSYDVQPALVRKFRSLKTTNMFRVQGSGPILVCNAPEFLATIGSDLKLRTHQRSVGLPAFQTSALPGLAPTGLIWDGKNLWSSDAQTNLLYKYGDDLRVLDTVRSILPKITGLAYDGEAIWVAGGEPLKLARLTVHPGGYIWQGPMEIKHLLPDKVAMAGMAVGFGRLWAVSGGDPKMVSVPLPVFKDWPTKSVSGGKNAN